MFVFRSALQHKFFGSDTIPVIGPMRSPVSSDPTFDPPDKIIPCLGHALGSADDIHIWPIRLNCRDILQCTLKEMADVGGRSIQLCRR